MKQDVTKILGRCKYCGNRFLPGVEGTLDGTICYEHEYIIDLKEDENGEQETERPAEGR